MSEYSVTKYQAYSSSYTLLTFLADSKVTVSGTPPSGRDPNPSLNVSTMLDFEQAAFERSLKRDGRQGDAGGPGCNKVTAGDAGQLGIPGGSVGA